MFIPNTDQFNFPEDTAGHYMEVHMDRGITFDEHYPYVDNSFSFRFKRFWVRVLLRLIVFPMTYFKMGLKIEGKDNLKRYKKELQNGAVTIANHVHRWDYICVMKAVHNYHWTYLISWDKNVNGEDGPLVRLVGGIPIPLHDNKATVAFNKAVNKVLQDKNFLHIYPEGSMWEYYSSIRPFKRGAAAFAIRNNKPVLPLAFTYCEPSALRKKLFKQIALFTLHVGKPIYPNNDLERNDKVDDLTIRMNLAVKELAKFKDQKEYPPIYQEKGE